MTRGIIRPLIDYNYGWGKLEEGDVVTINDGLEIYYDITKVEKITKEADYFYWINYANGKKEYYFREELLKYNVCFFDYNKWYDEGKLIFLGQIHPNDLIHIKCKILAEKDLGLSEIDNIKLTDIIDLDFQGHTLNTNYFRVYKPK